jgi:ABC-type transport system involved in multi-copper enzyme maturation permease subunit
MKALLVREFVVASKQKRLYVIRFALAAVLGYIMLMGVGVASTTGTGGVQLFASIVIATFFLVSLFILAQTSGCISDERRQGTLGLLLLTPLQAWHVVLGKFTTRFLEGVQIFLAILPMLFLPYAIGGLMFGQMATAILVLFSQMIICVAISLLASSFFRSGATAFMVSGCVIFGIETLGVTIINGVPFLPGPFHPAFTYINPMAIVFEQFQMTSGNLLGALLTLGTAVLISVAAFFVAAVQVSRLAAGDISFSKFKWPFRLRRNQKSRPEILAPILWLHSGRKVKVNLVVFVICMGVVGYTFYVGDSDMWLIVPLYAGSVLLSLTMSVNLIQRMQAEKEERIFELMFVSPISTREWLSQSIRASWLVYGLPILMMSSAASIASMYEEIISGDVWSIALSVLFIGYFVMDWYFLTIMSLFYGIKSRGSGSAFGTVLLYWAVTRGLCYCIPLILQLVIAENKRKLLQDDMRRMLTEEIY